MHVVIMPQIVSKVEICKTKLWIPKMCHVCVCVVWKRSPSFMSFFCACCLYFPTWFHVSPGFSVYIPLADPPLVAGSSLYCQ